MPGDKRTESFNFLAEPTDVNFGGKVHGGAVMKWIDQVGYACASGWSKRYCVTAYVGGIRFFRPIHIGHSVRLDAKVIYTGKTSMHIAVDVYSGSLWEDEWKKNTHCVMIFVAIDKDGNPTSVPKWTPETAEDKILENHAIRLMERRKELDEEMQPYLEK